MSANSYKQEQKMTASHPKRLQIYIPKSLLKSMMYIVEHTHSYTHTHTHTHTHTLIHTLTRTHTHSHAHSHTRTPIHTLIRTHTHTHTLTYTQTQTEPWDKTKYVLCKTFPLDITTLLLFKYLITHSVCLSVYLESFFFVWSCFYQFVCCSPLLHRS